jgi:3-oxoadipate enol-lactonase
MAERKVMPVVDRRVVARPDGAVLHAEAHGEGPTIVFAHGLGGSHLSWWQQVAHFAPTHRCIVFSHRGFFPSRAPEGGIDPACYAEDLVAILDAFGVGAAVLVGQSMGGWSVLECALRYPARVRGLVLSATSGTIDPATLGAELRAPLARWAADAETTRAACRADGIHVAAGPRMAREQPALHLLYRQIDETSAGLDKETLRARLVASRIRDAADAGRVACPALVAMGDEDIVVPWPIADALAARFRRGIARVYPATGHSPYFERAERFNADLAAFLATL